MKIAAAGACLLLAACDVNDPIYNTAHPDKGTLTLTTDWSGIGQGLAVPESYTVRVGDYTATLGGATNTLDRLFESGTCRMLVCNIPTNIRIEGNVAQAGHDGTYNPGWLFSCAAEVTISPDTDHACTAVMRQQVRELTLAVAPTGDAVARIVSVGGTLRGVACKLDLENGTHSLPGAVACSFSKIAGGAEAGKWAATLRLLGVVPGEKIELDLAIRFRDDNPRLMNVTSDLTSALAGFNDDKRTPLTLDGRVVETPSEAGFAGTIDNWTPVTGSGAAD